MKLVFLKRLFNFGVHLGVVLPKATAPALHLHLHIVYFVDRVKHGKIDGAQVGLGRHMLLSGQSVGHAIRMFLLLRITLTKRLRGKESL